MGHSLRGGAQTQAAWLGRKGSFVRSVIRLIRQWLTDLMASSSAQHLACFRRWRSAEMAPMESGGEYLTSCQAESSAACEEASMYVIPSVKLAHA